MTFLWVDLETTGLNPDCDRVLEIALGVSKPETPFDVTIIFDQAMSFTRTANITKIDPFVIEMHTKNGLWEDCARSHIATWELDYYLNNLFALQELEGDLFLAGSTVHFDRSFLKDRTPEFLKRLHHRHFDVSSIKLFCEALGMPKIPKGEAHRARADILESAAHARQCAKWLATRPREE